MKLIVALIAFRGFAPRPGEYGYNERDARADDRYHDFDEYDFGGPIPIFDDVRDTRGGIDDKVQDKPLPPLTHLKKQTFWRPQKKSIIWPQPQHKLAEKHPNTQKWVSSDIERARQESRRAWQKQQSNYKALRGRTLKSAIRSPETYRPPNLVSYDFEKSAIRSPETYRPQQENVHNRHPLVSYETNV
ncbi:MAG: hypothetical protein KVP17_005089 [Porospora cf. gigantea B]|uniref:uncharacterized protein n=1 Tax=Porospora cf. gigantea B TaxID=2853592 RepID=UPI0035719C59|nr:MAG: hypothetical protein KVP17_005089 [Porospora cf. gigantea B]